MNESNVRPEFKDGKPLCPECGHVMSHAGAGDSGRRMARSWKCPNCKRRWLDSRDEVTKVGRHWISKIAPEPSKAK